MKGLAIVIGKKPMKDDSEEAPEGGGEEEQDSSLAVLSDILGVKKEDRADFGEALKAFISDCGESEEED